MSRTKGHVPERTCVGCRRKGPKWEFLRVTRLPGNGVELDPDFRKPGRGAYVCWNEDCVRRARKRRALTHVLRTSVADEFYQELLDYVREHAGKKD